MKANLTRKKFTSGLKADVTLIKDFNTYKTNLLLQELGLFPLPENVQASLEDNILNIQLRDNPDEKHLIFNFPLEDDDLSYLKARPDYQELLDRYNLYTNEYLDELIKYAIMERKCIQEKFPDLIFNMKIRIKSYTSYLKKINDNIKEGKDPYINDIIAERIVDCEYKGSTDETLLKEKCDEIAKALYDFRINTNFRMKKDIEPNVANSEKEYITKDYIKHEKKNGYQSIHILMENKNNKDFTYETQIRTQEMEKESKTSGEISHKNYKPRFLNDLSPRKVPLYLEITPFSDEFGEPVVLDVPLENRFYHFYNSDKDMSLVDRKPSNPITYEKFRKEQYELEHLLGISFKELRHKLQNISSKNKENEEVR